MADIKISCVSCGKLFEVSDTVTGRNVRCPGCGNSIKVEPDETLNSARLKMKRRLKFCSECGTTLPENEICSNCGPVPPNVGSTGSDKPVKSSFLITALILAVALTILATGLAGYLWWTNRTTPMSADVEHDVDTPLITPLQDSSEPGHEQKAVRKPTVEYGPEEQKIRTELKKRLDQVSPIAVPGEKTELRRENGMFHSGIFVGVKDGNAIIRQSDGQEMLAPLEELDNPSRAKCDPEHRARVLEQAVQKKLEAAKSPF